MRVFDGDVEHRVVSPFGTRQIDQRLLHGGAVRFHQSAGAEFHATEVARHDRGDIAHVTVGEHRQHRSPGSAVWFAVVAHADAIGGSRRTNHVRPAIVRGVREFDVQLTNERLRLVG